MESEKRNDIGKRTMTIRKKKDMQEEKEGKKKRKRDEAMARKAKPMKGSSRAAAETSRKPTKKAQITCARMNE